MLRQSDGEYFCEFTNPDAPICVSFNAAFLPEVADIATKMKESEVESFTQGLFCTHAGRQPKMKKSEVWFGFLITPSKSLIF